VTPARDSPKLGRMRVDEEWLERVLAWRASGMTAAAYCVGKPFEVGALRAWSSRLGRAGIAPRSPGGRGARQAPVPAMRFARVTTQAKASSATASATPSAPHSTSSAMVVAIGESRIEVPNGFDPSLLRVAVEALAGGTR
jgi:hypothetical protein